MIWENSNSDLGTYTEFQDIGSHQFRAYTETTSGGTTDPGTGITTGATTTRTYYQVSITPSEVNPSTIVPLSGDPASLSGHFEYTFLDQVQYRGFDNNITTVNTTSPPVGSVWQKINTNLVDEVTSFRPDTTRSRTFTYTMSAYDILFPTVIIDTKIYTLNVTDRNWTTGMNSLRALIDLTRTR